MKKLFFAFFIIMFLTGCNTIRELADVQKPSVRYSGLSVDKFSFSDVTLLFDFEVSNPNNFGVSADQYSYDFLINGNEFVSGIQDQNLRIENNSTTNVQIPVSLSFSEVYETVESLARRDSMSYKLSTEVQFDIGGIGKQRVPVSAEGEFPIPKLPGIELGSFDVEKFSLSGAEMVASFKLENPNPFGINFENAFFNLEVKGAEWLNTRLDRAINLGSSETQVVRIPIELETSLIAGMALMDILRGETEFEYHLKGSADVSADIKGLNIDETLTFDRIGTYKMN